MKIYRRLVTQRGLAPLIPLLEKLDSTLLCLMHHGSSRTGMKALRQSRRPESRKILNAIRHSTVSKEVEKQRGAFLSRTSLLDPEGPFDKDVTVSAACAISKSPRQAALLAAIVREFAPTSALELGTNVGISSAYMAASMLGTLVTLEASTARQELAKEMHANLALSNVEYVLGLFDDMLDGVLEGVPGVDFAFIDGHHEYGPTLDYFERIAKRSSPGAVFVFDDINWSEGMKNAWSKLKVDERFGLVVDFWTVGVCVLDSGEEPRVVAGPITCR